MKSSLAFVLPSLAFAVSIHAQPDRPTAAETAFPQTEPLAAGPFQPTWASLQTYKTPEWFRDAKFGIWAHWGPQCQPEMGDWYARFLYEPAQKRPWARAVYAFHLARYGHPSEFGFKDVIRTWRAENWDPEKLMALYRRAGAGYFMALANHHDNFDLWDSKYQTWNAARLGPGKDLVAGWAAAARRAGLRFGVSVHAARAWEWYEPSRGADSAGPFAGVPYDGSLTAADGRGRWWDGLDPQDLYAQNHAPNAKPSPAYRNKFFNRTLDLINRYDPDLVYFDDTVLPFYPETDLGLKIAAHFYNASLARHSGKLEAVLNGKQLTEPQRHAMVYDLERGKSPGILPLPWQTDTCIGSWHYDRSLYEQDRYKTAPEIIRMLVDIVSKNGNLMLNIPLRGDGTADPAEIAILGDIAAWMDLNRIAIFATRPWRIYGEGPSTVAAVEKGSFDGIKDTGQFTAEDIRFTASKDGHTLFAIFMDRPTGPAHVTIASLTSADRIADVSMLGGHQRLAWVTSSAGLTVTLAETHSVAGPCVLQITLAP